MTGARRLQRGRHQIASVMLLFFLQPLAFGGVLVRIPDLQAALGLNKAELSWALLCIAGGAMLILPLASTTLRRLGARTTLLIGFPAFAGALVTVGLAGSLPGLMGSFLLVGFTLAFTELGLNAHAAAVEQQSARHIMNSAHGCWSVGLLVGSFGGVQLASLQASVFMAVACLAALELAAAAKPLHMMPKHERAPAPGAAAAGPPARINAALLAACLFIVGFAMTEGAMIDWSAVYLRELMGPQAAEAGYGVTVFAGFVAAGRFAGDALKRRLGAVRLARLALCLALAGLGLIVANFSLSLVFCGFALAGLGVASGFPLAVSAAAQATSDRPRNLASVTLAAEVAFLIGPVCIGMLAELTSLRIGLLVLVPALLLSFACSRWLR